ncbi:MAG: RidA family protein [Verrucomicrobia bacterium]|nr:RidA family protein [Verrucomicrobiota bacterium]
MFRAVFFLCALISSLSGFCDQNATYSSAVTAGDFIYVSGQLPVDPSTGTLIEGDIQTLTNQVINNMEHLLKVKGVTLKQVIKTQVYLTDIRDYDAMNAAYGQRFNFQYPPARDVVAVSDLPFNARLEISCIAYKNRN